MKKITVPLTLLPHGKDLALPAYVTAQSAGLDLMAAIEGEQILGPMQRALIPCGFAMALPQGFEAQVRPRSGLALKHGVTVLNSPGTIDADYRGEIKVLLVNLSNEPFVITRGMRIAQMVLAPYTHGSFEQVENLNESARGVGGFGSTGS